MKLKGIPLTKVVVGGYRQSTGVPELKVLCNSLPPFFRFTSVCPVHQQNVRPKVFLKVSQRLIMMMTMMMMMMMMMMIIIIM